MFNQEELTILALETSQQFLSVCAYRDGRYTEINSDARLRQAEDLLPCIEQCLVEAKIDKAKINIVIYSQGPGSFTSIRVSLGFALACQAVHGTSLIGISSLAALAFGARRLTDRAKVLTCLDARGQQIYYGAYRFVDGRADVLVEDCVADPTPDFKLFPEEDLGKMAQEQLILVGSGWQKYPDLMIGLKGTKKTILLGKTAKARDLIDLSFQSCAPGVIRADGQSSQPSYLRNGL